MVNPEVLKAAQKSGPASVSEDKLDKIKAAATVAALLRKRKEKLEALLTETNERIDQVELKELPELMDGAGVPSITVELTPEQGGGRYKVDAKPYYRANIAVKWEPERREAAFAWLQDHGHGAIVKTQITVTLDVGELEEAQKLQQELAARGLEVDLGKNVNHQTLTAWLKEQVEKTGEIPPLDTLGAFVGRIAKPKEL